MLRMAQIDYIKDLYENEDLSLREISRRTGHSFQTVQKYAYQENWSAEQLPNLEAENYPNLEKYIPSTDEWMELDRKLPRKQRHTAMRIYHRLVEEQGYQGSYSSVKRYVRKKKFVLKLAAEGYLPLAQPCGYGQVDFGESLYYDSQGRERKGYALTVSFPQSNKGYTQFFPSQNQECLLEGLKRVFEHIGGVPPRLRFDNLSTAVVKVLEGGERELTEGFTRFMLHFVRRNSALFRSRLRRELHPLHSFFLSPCDPLRWASIGFPYRLIHHSHIVIFYGESYRLTQSMNRQRPGIQ